MRHFLHRGLGPEPIAVARLPSRMETPSSQLPPVFGSGAPERLTPLRAAALPAQPLPAIAPRAEAELNPTPLAHREPVLRRRQGAPCRRFLDMDPEMW
jgi:hypothetical protein